jgi:signal transduction histidine kinase
MSMGASRSDQSLLQLLQALLDVPALELRTALTAATTQVAKWLDCEKVDAFLLDEARTSLVAVGTSRTPLGERQKALGLDFLPLANNGRIVETFRTGISRATGRADLDENELVGIVRDLGVRSAMSAPLEIGGVRRGVLAAASQQPDRFAQDDIEVLELIARWLGALAQRAELVEAVRANEGASARQATAERIITIASHDIRNYLNPIMGRLRLLQLKVKLGQTVDATAIDPILLGAQRLARLTSTWLDLSRLDKDLFELQLAPLNLRALLSETCAALSLGKTPIRLVASESFTLIGDAERLRQAFENVLANAVRYSPPSLPVEVRVEPLPESAAVRVSVSDHGPGIPPELLPHLFERFVASAHSGGIGLGLYLAERIVAAHGGTLEASTAPSGGAEFLFQLPLDASGSAGHDG